MGHERVGYLPKTKSWNQVVASIREFSDIESGADSIAKQTLKTVKSRFLNISDDPAFNASFKCLVLLSYANRTNDPYQFLAQHGLQLSADGGLFQLVAATQRLMEHQKGSKEYGALATKALIDTINKWVKSNEPGASLFTSEKNLMNSWRKAANGEGFCEVSREFFSQFTTQYLRYFLDRAASANVNSIEQSNQLSDAIRRHTSDISTHAFETAKIAQSFAAGWFKNHATKEMPSDRKIKGFLSIVTKKFYDEFSREQNGKRV